MIINIELFHLTCYRLNHKRIVKRCWKHQLCITLPFIHFLDAPCCLDVLHFHMLHFPVLKRARLITVSASLLALHILHAKWLQQWRHPVIHEDSSGSQIWLHSSGAMALHDMLAGKALYTWKTEAKRAEKKMLHKPSGPHQITFWLFTVIYSV